MAYTVYILFSESFDKYYIGQTNNLTERLQRHNSGQVNFTRRYVPWVVALSIPKETRSESMLLEKKLKHLNRKRLIEFIKKYR